MPTMKGLKSLVELLPKHDPKDALLIPDANFLFDLENNHLWAVNGYAKAKLLAEAHGKSLRWRIPRPIMFQYEKAKEEGRKDGLGIPLVHGSLDKLMPTKGFVYSTFDSSIADLTGIILSFNPRLESNDELHQQRIILEGLEKKVAPGLADVWVIFATLGYASQNTEVYVASRDYKDITNRLIEWSEIFGLANLDINIIHRSPVEMKYRGMLNGKPMELISTLAGEVIKWLLEFKETSYHYPVVIFEKDVKSGDATFDVGVGVAVKRMYKTFELPEEYDAIKDNYKTVPALLVSGFPGRRDRDWRKIRDLAAATNAREVFVLDVEKPAEPMMFIRKGSGLLQLGQYRTDLGFLYYNSSSKFAQANYVPFNR
ncbi:MAG: hypothetical protein AABX34_02235 [Nanoarchaeota archaeon]